MSKYEAARKFAIDSIEKALVAHERGDDSSIENGLEEFQGLIPREELAPNSLLLLTEEFWCGWSSCAEHDWQFFEPLGKDDWPRLARILLDDLTSNREVTDSVLLSEFRVVPKDESGSFLSRLWGRIRGKAI